MGVEFKVSSCVAVCGVDMCLSSTVSSVKDWRWRLDVGDSIGIDNVLECLCRAEPSCRGLSKDRDLLFTGFRVLCSEGVDLKVGWDAPDGDEVKPSGSLWDDASPPFTLPKIPTCGPGNVSGLKHDSKSLPCRQVSTRSLISTYLYSNMSKYISFFARYLSTWYIALQLKSRSLCWTRQGMPINGKCVKWSCG